MVIQMCAPDLPRFKCVQKWGTTLGSAFSIACILVIVVDCIRFEKLRSFTRRPGAPLLFRALCNFIFCMQFLVTHLLLEQFYEPEADSPGQCLPESICRFIAFITQFTVYRCVQHTASFCLILLNFIYFCVQFPSSLRRNVGTLSSHWTSQLTCSSVRSSTHPSGSRHITCACGACQPLQPSCFCRPKRPATARSSRGAGASRSAARRIRGSDSCTCMAKWRSSTPSLL